jgi:putative tryptophan/tyrosine transport system substrate-binding protein
VNRRVVLSALVLTCAFGIFLLETQFACASQPVEKTARIGFVGTETLSRGVPAFWERLHELGWIEGKNLSIETRWAEGHVERLPTLMNEVIARKVDVLFTYGTPAAIAAKKATATVPIVAAMMGDPLGTGLVASLARPGRNLTGISLAMSEGLGGKWMQLLHEAVPRLVTIAVIGNPASPWVPRMTKELETDARTRGLTVRFLEVRDIEGLDRAFAKAQREAQGAILLGDPLVLHNWQRILSLAAKYRVPTMYPNPEWPEHGGLMAYGADSVVAFRRAAEYVDQILRGAKPGNLPIEQPTQFKLVINLKTAGTLGLTIPESVLVQADEVIR